MVKKKIIFLMIKDFRENSIAIGLALMIPSVFIFAGYLMSTFYFERFETRDCLYLISRIGLLTPLIFGEFLIIREKNKKTHSLIRNLPISELEFYLSKNFTSWSIVLASAIPGFILLHIEFSNSTYISYYFIIILLFIFTSTLVLYLSLKMKMRLIFLITYIGAEILIYLWRTFEDYYPDEAFQIVTSDWIFLVASIFLISGTYIFYHLGVLHLQNRDTKELVT